MKSFVIVSWAIHVRLLTLFNLVDEQGTRNVIRFSGDRLRRDA